MYRPYRNAGIFRTGVGLSRGGVLFLKNLFTRIRRVFY